MPFTLIHRVRDGQRNLAAVLVRVVDLCLIEICQSQTMSASSDMTVQMIWGFLTPCESILIICSWVIRNLDATLPLPGVLEQVDVRSFVKTMVTGLDVRGGIKVVDVTEAVSCPRAGC